MNKKVENLKSHIVGHQKCVLCTETEHISGSTSEMCTVHRNRTLSRLYIRNVYCAQKQNTSTTVHQKCALCTESEHFPHGTSEMFTVHRNRTLSKRYKEIVLCTETRHFLYGTSQMCNVHRITHSWEYIRNVYCAEKQNILQTVHLKCALCTESEHFSDGTSEIFRVHRNRTLSKWYKEIVLCTDKTLSSQYIRYV